MRLIDADAMMEQLVSKHAHSWGKVERAYGEAIEALCNAPTVDAEPVRHGKWIEHPTIFKYISHWECSVCNSWHGERGMNYCPNCGAKMDGVGR